MVSNEKRITAVHESSCGFVESVDTSHPGLIEASRQLVAIANKLVGTATGADDPVLAGEVLLLAGYSALLYTLDNKPTNMAVHLKGLVLNGQPLPIQSIYIAMKEEQIEKPVQKSSPRQSLVAEDRQPETNDPDQDNTVSATKYPRHNTVESIESAIDYTQIQAEIDAETTPEILDAAREFEAGTRRFVDKPSVADQKLTNALGRYQQPSHFRTIRQNTDLHGGHD